MMMTQKGGAMIRSTNRARGVSIIYVTVLIVVMFGFISFAVDLGRVQLAKTELQRAADAAARFGAAGLATGTSTARDNAIASAAENAVDGKALELSHDHVAFGKWDSTARTFTTITPPSSQINAIRVTARRSSADGTGVPLLFAGVLGASAIDVGSVATAVFNPAISIDLPVPASSNPWLAGMPDGTLANPTPPKSTVRRDQAGPYTDPAGVFHPNGESPAQLTGMSITPGTALNFDAIAGTGQHGPTQTIVGPDGNTAKIQAHKAGAEHGKSSLKAPIDAVVGVFLDDDVPSGSPPPDLDFSTESSRDFTSLSPQLKQVFFIGDGKTSSGAVQQFTVPQGATRLFIGKMDGYEWNNNLGVSTVTIYRPASVSLVN